MVIVWAGERIATSYESILERWEMEVPVPR
jgi:hypothetical protein